MVFKKGTFLAKVVVCYQVEINILTLVASVINFLFF